MNTYKNLHTAIIAIACCGLIGTSLSSWTLSSATRGYHKDKVYDKVDEMPRFPGCEGRDIDLAEKQDCSMKEMFKFIGKEVKYPKEALKTEEHGTVIVSFVVSKEGVLRDFEVKRAGQLPLIEAEALRAIKAMPTWVPGVHGGEKVDVAMVLPVKFELPEQE